MYKYEAQNSKKSLKKTKFEVEKKLNMKSTQIKNELENVEKEHLGHFLLLEVEKKSSGKK